MNRFAMSTGMVPNDPRSFRRSGVLTAEQWVRGEKGEIVTAEDWARGNGNAQGFRDRSWEMIRPMVDSSIGPDDVHIAAMLLCNDQRDYYNSQFSRSALGEIAELAPGMPIMRMHNYKTGAPEATAFDARVVKRDLPALAVRGASCVDVHYFWGKGAAGDELMQRHLLKMDKEVSIGWRCLGADCTECGEPVWGCRHIPGDVYSKGIAGFDFSGVTNVLEGSFVFRGGQKETTTYIPDGARAEPMAAVASAVNRFLETLSGEMRWDAIGSMKREFLLQIDRMPREIRVAAETYRRALGMGTLCAEPGDRGNTQAVTCSRSRFETEAQAKRWARDNDFRVDHMKRSDAGWEFEQFARARLERDGVRDQALDAGVVGRVGKLKAPAQEGERSERTVRSMEDWAAGPRAA